MNVIEYFIAQTGEKQNKTKIESALGPTAEGYEDGHVTEMRPEMRPR